MHTICTPSGQVLRIVIFKKNGVQAMVEYPFTIQNLVLQHGTTAYLQDLLVQ